MTKNRGVTIRPLQPDDRQAWNELWQAYLDFYQTPLAPEVTEATWARLHDPAEPMYCLCAEIGGEVMGITHYLLHRSSWAKEHYCYLEDLFVAPAARGHGAGEALIEAVADAARLANADRLYWITHEANSTARSLYDRLAMRAPFVQYRKVL